MIQISENVPLSPYTTYKIGGVAKFFTEVHSEQDILEAYEFSNKNNLKIYILGSGSNLLISDKGVNGLVIYLGKNFSKINIIDNIAIAQAGAKLNLFISYLKNHSLGGLEPLFGIPGSIGGAITMNAGAFDTEIADKLIKVRYLDLNNGNICEKDPSLFNFDYRYSDFQKEDKLVISGTFKLHYTDKNTILSKLKSTISKRRQRQNIKLPNAGSVFKNPSQTIKAAQLLDEFKGLTIGDAMLSLEHSNFIVNKGQAKASDIYLLIKKLQSLVYTKYNIYLTPEIKFWGEF